MIKLHSKGTAPDYTEHGSVSTDCKTVGQFMTEAAAIYVGGLVIEVDGCRYKFSGNPKIRVADNTPVGEITYTSVPGGITFIVKTKPKPKTVKRSGWVNVLKYSDSNPFPAGVIYPDKKSCESDEAFICCKDIFVAVAKIEWEEVVK